jgi:hypothetical protein
MFNNFIFLKKFFNGLNFYLHTKSNSNYTRTVNAVKHSHPFLPLSMSKNSNFTFFALGTTNANKLHPYAHLINGKQYVCIHKIPTEDLAESSSINTPANDKMTDEQK